MIKLKIMLHAYGDMVTLLSKCINNMNYHMKENMRLRSAVDMLHSV